MRQELVDHREAFRVSWFATAGAFEADRTGRGEDEAETYSDNAWTAPEFAGTVYMLIVVRELRGSPGRPTKSRSYHDGWRRAERVRGAAHSRSEGPIALGGRREAGVTNA